MNPTGTVPLTHSRLRGVTAILAAVLSATLFAAPQVLPFAVLLALIAGSPLAIERVRIGLGSAAFATALAVLLVTVALGASHAIVFLFFQAMPALLIGESVARGRGLRVGAVWAFWLLFAEIACLLIAMGSAVPQSLSEAFAKMASPEALARSGMSPESVVAWTEQWKAAEKIAMVIYPAAAVVFACLVVLAQVAVVRFFIVRHQPGLIHGESFETLRLPFGAVFLFLLGGSGVFFEPLRPLSYNVLAILGFFFALQGFAIALYFVRRMAGPAPLRGLLLLLILIPAWSPYVLALLGLFDVWFDLRRFAEPRPAA